MATKKDEPKGNGKADAKRVCFVISPIGDEDSETRIHADWFLDGIVRPVLDDIGGFEVVRADKIASPGMIDDQIINALLNDDLAIADLTELNPNVLYEVGLRHMAQKPIVHMHERGVKLPFDQSMYRSIEYSRKEHRDLEIARSKLKPFVEAVLAPGYQVDNPVTRARGRLELEAKATPEERLIMDQFEAINLRLLDLERGQPSKLALNRTRPRSDLLAREADSGRWYKVLAVPRELPGPNEIVRLDGFERRVVYLFNPTGIIRSSRDIAFTFPRSAQGLQMAGDLQNFMRESDLFSAIEVSTEDAP